MKRSKFTEAQIAFILRQAEEGTAVGEVCRKAGISEATFYAWRKKYAGLMPSEMKRLRQLECEAAPKWDPPADWGQHTGIAPKTLFWVGSLSAPIRRPTSALIPTVIARSWSDFRGPTSALSHT